MALYSEFLRCLRYPYPYPNTRLFSFGYRVLPAYLPTRLLHFSAIPAYLPTRLLHSGTQPWAGEVGGSALACGGIQCRNQYKKYRLALTFLRCLPSLSLSGFISFSRATVYHHSSITRLNRIKHYKANISQESIFCGLVIHLCLLQSSVEHY